MHRSTRRATVLALAGGLAAAAASAGEVALPGRLGGLSLEVESLQERRYRGVVRQRYDFSCGAASAATLLTHHYGLPTREDDAMLGMLAAGDEARIRAQGFSLLDIKRYLERQGVRANGYEQPLDTLEEAGLPAVVLVDVEGYRHFVVVKGVTADSVLVGDPARGLERYDRAAFERAWNGILLVVEDLVVIGRRRFNEPRIWGALPRAPLGRPLAPEVLRTASWMLRGPNEF